MSTINQAKVGAEIASVASSSIMAAAPIVSKAFIEIAEIQQKERQKEKKSQNA